MRRNLLHRELLPPRLAAIAFFCALLFSLVSSARARELRIEHFSSEIIVSPNSHVSVTETIQVRFIGSWHGLYREIPVEYVTPQGLNYTLFLTVKRITDGDGTALKFENSRERHYRKLKIYVPNAEDARRTIVIEYEVSDGLRYFEDHDELYWNVTGDEWDVPIQEADARIVLPENTSGVRANQFTGAYGSRAQNADVQIVGNGVEVHTRESLGYHEGFTIAIAFDKGFVHEPTRADKISLFFRSNWPLFVPFLAFFFMFWEWWKNGRDPRLRPIAALYEPPDQLTPGEIGTLLDDSADMRDITATIVDLAVRGFLVIEEHSKEHMMGLWKDKDYSFILRKARSEWAALKDHEQTLLGGIFSAGTVGETVSMGSLQNRFYANLPELKNNLFDSLVTHGYYRRRPDSTRQAWLGGGLVLGFLIALGGPTLGNAWGMAPFTFILTGILTGLVVCGFGWFMPARTEKGTRALEGTLGFEDFLNHVEADRFNKMIKTPAMFEKFLPFAMALGVEKNWSNAFKGIYTQPPDWYRGGVYGPSFYPYMFVNNLGAMSSQASTVFASAPRSSGGSGFGGGGGGGGFSGGGFGGGGGGGF